MTIKIEASYTSNGMYVLLETSRKENYKWFCEVFNTLCDVFNACPKMTSGFSCGKEDLLRIEVDIHDKKYFSFFKLLENFNQKEEGN